MLASKRDDIATMLHGSAADVEDVGGTGHDPPVASPRRARDSAPVPFTYDYPRPAVTVDLALFATGPRGELQLLLIQRKKDPFAGRWALPGGFVDADEDLAAAARRELLEETGLRGGRLVQLSAYGTPGRDPRGHTVSVVFVAACDRAAMRSAAGDDAAACDWFAARKPPRLAFDHRVILRDAVQRLAALAADREQFGKLLFGGRTPKVAEAVRRAARAAGKPAPAKGTTRQRA